MAQDTGDRADELIGGLDGRLIAGRFRLDQVVSAGANTVIVDALDIETNQPVTVKLVRPELAASTEFRAAFRRHAEVAIALSHPNIATVIGSGEVDLGTTSTVYWVVEYLGGGSMRDLLDRGRLLAPSQALVVGLEACRALDAAHQRGIVHTELTPSKMVFGDDRRLRVVDFGFARLLGAAAWADPATVPTHVARYASPEQALGEEVGVKTDVYALTLSLIEAVTGSVPFAADSTVATLAARVGKLMPVSADLGSLASVLERAGRPEPEDRSTAAEFGRALVQAASKLPRPEPIPIVAGGLFATSELRRPSDPTGGLARPPDEADQTEGAAGAAAAAAGAAAVAGAVAGAAVADAAASGRPPDPGVVVGDADRASGAGEAPADELAVADGVPPVDPPAPGAVAVAASGTADAPPADDQAAEGDAPGADSAGPDAGQPGDAVESGMAAGLVAPPAVTAEAADATGRSGGDPADADSAARSGGAAILAGGVAAAASTDGTDGSAGADVPAGADTAAGVDTAAGLDGSAGTGAADSADGSAGTDVVTDGADTAAGAALVAAGAVGDAPLVVVTDIADPPTGAVEVGTNGKPAVEPTVPMPITGGPGPAPAVYDEERPRRSVAKILVLTLVVLLGLGALGYAGWLLLRTKSFDVPDLAGVNESIALNEVAGNGWVIITTRERSDEEPTIDNVIRTEPGPGVRLDEGEEFLLVVSDGPLLRTLDEYAGRPVSEVESELREQRLEPVVEVREFSETVPLDSVVSWRVQGDDAATAGSQVLPETTILLTVSDGPAPRPAPALSGLLVEQAQVEVESLQLVFVRGDDVFSETVPIGVVVSQEPAAGTLIPRGGGITVQVSKGPDLVPVPDLSGLSYPDAEVLLRETGFVIGNLLGTTEGTFVSITINGDSVAPGDLFLRGTVVDLIFL